MRNTAALVPLAALAASSLLFSAGACSSKHAVGGGGGSPNGDDGGDAGNGPLPFAPDSPNVYVAKVKNVLVGLPPTDDELKTVTADPTQLGALVDGWMKLPQYTTKMMRFFELAFQQTQITPVDFADMLDQGQLQLSGAPVVMQTLQESFARTMLNLSASGQPFTKAMSTQTHALTTALKVFYALLDVWQIDNTLDAIHDYFKASHAGVTIYATAKGPIPIAQTLDPSSPNYMHWYVPDVANLGGGAACATDPVSYGAAANTLYYILQGVLPGRKLADGTMCPGGGGKTLGTGPLQPSDYSDWTMVDIRQPNGSEKTTDFFDLQTLRGGTEMILKRPYVGFFTTPAFFANWQTNASNQMRVTINQTLIVATGAQIDGADATKPSMTPGLDATHASNPACVTCHQLLDPTRSILAATYSWNYGMQSDAKFIGQPGLFAFQGVEAPVKSVYDLGSTLASHPLVASGWANKLCYYVNSEACEPSDPEFQRIVSLFTSSNFSWDQLVKAVVTSPITTHAQTTVTATTNGEVVAVSRRDHLCAAWSVRLGLGDFCGLDVTQAHPAPANALAIVGGLPSDGYGRGSVAPVLPNQPSLFFRGASENLCEAIAALVIDNKTPPAGAKTWSSAQPDAAIADFVAIVMGLPPSDPRSTQATALLKAHFDGTKSMQGSTPTSALQSTFTAACMSPSAVSIGM